MGIFCKWWFIFLLIEIVDRVTKRWIKYLVFENPFPIALKTLSNNKELKLKNSITYEKFLNSNRLWMTIKKSVEFYKHSSNDKRKPISSTFYVTLFWTCRDPRWFVMHIFFQCTAQKSNFVCDNGNVDTRCKVMSQYGLDPFHYISDPNHLTILLEKLERQSQFIQ